MVNKYFKIIPFEKTFIKPILDLKRSSKRYNDSQMVKDNNNDINSYI